MNTSLSSQASSDVFESIKSPVRGLLVAINKHQFSVAQEAISGLREELISTIEEVNAKDGGFSNDMFVLNRYIDLVSAYGVLWEKIIDMKFSNSWGILQDALDLLRIIKRFSRIDISYFENQLIELERSYPYKVFFSIGGLVEYFECSICGNNIDSLACAHMCGQLYDGKMAIAIARNFTKFEEVSIVAHPENKRCVVAIDDDGEQFKVIRYISNMLSSVEIRISDFCGFLVSRRMFPNTDYQKLGRNEPCYCESGKKFKYCCIGREYIEGDHFEVIVETKCIENAVT